MPYLSSLRRLMGPSIPSRTIGSPGSIISKPFITRVFISSWLPEFSSL